MSSKLPSLGVAHSLGRRVWAFYDALQRSVLLRKRQCQLVSVLHTLGLVLSLGWCRSEWSGVFLRTRFRGELVEAIE